MLDILICNILFWTVWLYLSYLPVRIFQRMIDHPEKFFQKSEKNS